MMHKIEQYSNWPNKQTIKITKNRHANIQFIPSTDIGMQTTTRSILRDIIPFFFFLILLHKIWFTLRISRIR